MAESGFKCFVGGISWQMDDAALKAEFVEFGAETAEVMMDKVTGRSRGFGFVHFTSKEGMDDAIAKRHNTEIDGRKISVRSAIPQDQIPPGQRGRSSAPRGYAGASGGYGERSYDRGGGGGYERGGYGGGGYGGGYGGGGYGGGGYGDYYGRGGEDYYRGGGYGGGYGGYGGYGYGDRGGYDAAARAGYGGGYSGGYGAGPDRGGASRYPPARSGPYERPR